MKPEKMSAYEKRRVQHRKARASRDNDFTFVIVICAIVFYVAFAGLFLFGSNNAPKQESSCSTLTSDSGDRFTLCPVSDGEQP